MNRCAIAVVLMAVASVTSATANPHVIWSGPQDIVIGTGGAGGVDIDVDTDGVLDLFYFCHQEAFINGRVGSAAYGTLEPDPYNPGEMRRGPDYPLEYGHVIGAVPQEGHAWYDDDIAGGPFVYLANWLGPPAGPWLDVDNGYMGFSVEQGDGTHYGWVQMSVGLEIDGIPFDQVTIHDWAYSSIPGESIGAGVIPEPATVGLFALGLAAMLARHLRRSSRG